MAQLSDISQQYWQLSTEDAGQVVQGYESLQQNLANIIRTAKGSVPLNPEFGLDIAKFQDSPGTTAAGIIRREILDQVEIFEPRIKIVGVSASATIDGRLSVTVRWRAADANLAEINIYQTVY